MALKTFTIDLKYIKLLQTCLSISSGLHGTGVINLTIGNDTITSTTTDPMDSCYKHWSIPISMIGKVGEEKLDRSIKCSIFKGSDFVNKILAQCSKPKTTTQIIFHYDEITDSVKQIELICKSDESKKKVFSFKFATSDVSLLFTDFDTETIEFFFSNETSAELKYQFKMTKDTLKSVREMMNLTIHDDTQNNYISLKFDAKEQTLSFTDEITDFVLPASEKLGIISEELSTEVFNIDKSVFKKIDSIDWHIELRTLEGSNFIVFRGTNPDIVYVTTIPLLEAIKSTVSYEDVLKDKGTFG